MAKYLIIRFSSIGDIVLTSPVIRCLKEQQPDCEIHFATKIQFKNLVENNPHITKVYAIKNEIDEIVADLKDENYDFVIDLHHNLRTARLKRKLKKPSAAFPKLNYQKFLLTKFKINRLPKIHIVDRYFKAVEKLGVINDNKGLDYFIPNQDEINLAYFGIENSFIAFAIGAQFETKKLTIAKMIELINQLDSQVVLLGGENDFDAGEEIKMKCKNVVNLSGRLNLNQSAHIIKQAQTVITHDTGLMHIAAAFNKRTISIWGNTVPDFGMYPYQPNNESNYSIHQVENLKCRPCSKIGYQKCPKGHFKCMNNQDIAKIASAAKV